jgi:transaldolase|tara:strand:- start:1368 stop:2090 length:723 start_codon:yes stop_codon:yes gene_type:complete
MNLDTLKIKIFADGADVNTIKSLNAEKWVQGFTTNPTLMKQAGVEDYKSFALEVLAEVKEKPISFEVFADDFSEMEEQAKEIASWGENIYVKIPVTNTKGESSKDLIKNLSEAGVRMNITAVFTTEQTEEIVDSLAPETANIISIFAGRIADAGTDPVPVMKNCLNVIKSKPKTELLWASPREVLNLLQADEIGCHIITITNDLLQKTKLIGKSLEEYSKETVEMFFNDASEAGYKIETK